MLGHKIMTTQERPAAAAPPPVPGLPLIGNSLQMWRDPAAFFYRGYREHGPVYRVRVFGREQTVLAGPEAAEFLGSAEGRDCLRSKEFWSGLVHEYGASRTLTGVDGDIHHEMRRIMRRGYSRNAISGHYDEVIDLTRIGLNRYWPTGSAVSVVPALQRLVVDQLGMLTTGQAPQEYVEDIRLLITYILNVLVTKQRPRVWLADPRYARAKRRVKELGESMMRDLRSQPPRTGEDALLVDDIMRANRERPDLIPDSDLVLSLTGPYVAGLDTVANTLAATIYGILRDREIHRRVIADAESLFDGEPVTTERITGLTAINGAVSEAMRLWPIAVAQMRTATRDFTFAGHQIHEGEMLYIGTSVSHFMPEFYPEPERFDIDRYAKPRAEHRAPGAYSPFGRGPHLCLGKGLAEIQMPLTLAVLFSERRLSLLRPGYRMPMSTAPTPGPSRRFRVRSLPLV